MSSGVLLARLARLAAKDDTRARFIPKSKNSYLESSHSSWMNSQRDCNRAVANLRSILSDLRSLVILEFRCLSHYLLTVGGNNF